MFCLNCFYSTYRMNTKQEKITNIANLFLVQLKSWQPCTKGIISTVGMCLAETTSCMNVQLFVSKMWWERSHVGFMEQATAGGWQLMKLHGDTDVKMCIYFYNIAIKKSTLSERYWGCSQPQGVHTGKCWAPLFFEASSVRPFGKKLLLHPH